MKKDLDNKKEIDNSSDIINNVDDTEEELDIVDLTDMRLYSILTDLDKACALLDKMLDDNMFSDEDEPNVKQLKDTLEGNVENIFGSSTERWVRDYNTIYQFIDIVFDYTDKARNELEDILFNLYDEEEENKE